MERLVGIVNDVVWSPALIVLLIGAGLYFTIRTRCVQIRRIGAMARLLFSGMMGKHDGKNGISSFQAFCVALSGRVGTGNIVGVATAIAIGGPGSIFWMWAVAFLGSSTAFMESTLAQIYRFKHNGLWRGGPAAYIEKGLGKKGLAILFAVLTIIGYGLLLATVQSNGVAGAFHNSFEVSPLTTGLVLAAILGLVVIGGVKRISNVASIVTPFMALAYVAFSVVIIAINWRSIPGVLSSIFTSAFGIGPAMGGAIGTAISMGVKRGLFSNEAGQGGGAIVSASADVDMPAKQGLVQAFSVYIDTLLVCTATALMILCTGADKAAPAIGDNYVAFTQLAIDTVFKDFGSAFVSISLAFFSFTTIMAYYFYTESSILYLCKDRQSPVVEKTAIWIYRVLFLGTVVAGAVMKSGIVWTMGDIGIGMTTWVNVIVLLLLCPHALKALSDFEAKNRK